MMRDFPSMITIDPEFPPARRHGRTGNSDQTITLAPPSFGVTRLRLAPAECPPRLREIAKQHTAVAHAGARGQVFGRIVRHTWRIAAFGKQPELERARQSRSFAWPRCLVTIATMLAGAIRQSGSSRPAG